MREGIHPEYKEAVIQCSCGVEIKTRSTIGDFHIEVCSNCHPFYTGKQKNISAAGRAEQFRKKYAQKKAAS